MNELLLFLSLFAAVIGLCLALDELDRERRESRRRNQARPRSWR